MRASFLIIVGVIVIGILLLREKENASPDMPSVLPPASAASLAAQAALTRKLSVSVDEITVTSTEPVQWSDASLGCPQPGHIYVQVMTAGFRVNLRYKDQVFIYHTDTADTAAETRAVDCTGNPHRQVYENTPASRGIFFIY